MNAKKVVLLCLLMCSAAFAYAQQPTVGLITKTETNPFFVKMKEGRASSRQSRWRQADERAPASSTATTPARLPRSRTWSPRVPRQS